MKERASLMFSLFVVMGVAVYNYLASFWDNAAVRLSVSALAWVVGYLCLCRLYPGDRK